jgi:CheY-like chemotaxis protein
MQWVVQKMSRYGLHVDVEDDGKAKRLDEETLVLTYHSVHELLFNVLKHAGTRKAKVVLRDVGDHLEVAVIDEGQGFDTSAKHVPTERGGFGLFSIRERITLLGGRCEIVSVLGKGTCATIIVPLRLGSLNVEQHPSSGSPDRVTVSKDHTPSVAHGLRVLLADDHAVMRQGLRSLLKEDASLEVVGEANDGETAVQLVGRLRPSVVIMDVDMPKMNGFEATRRIKQQFPHTVVIGLSFLNDPGTAAAMGACGASAYVSKEQVVSHLLKTIHMVTEQEDISINGSTREDGFTGSGGSAERVFLKPDEMNRYNC